MKERGGKAGPIVERKAPPQDSLKKNKGAKAKGKVKKDPDAGDGAGEKRDEGSRGI